jgi:hypothetical protein
MSHKSDESKAPLPRWLLLPLGLGLLLSILGLAMPWLYPEQSLWTDEDAKKHTELALQTHAAHHASANSKINALHTVKEDVAKARWYREQYDQSAERLQQVREGGNRYGNWLLIAGIALTASGVVAALMLRKE